MPRAMIALTTLLLCASAAPADISARTAAEVTQADREFAQRAATEGTAAAFRDTTDLEEGLAFTGIGKPARGSAAVFAAMGGTKPDNTLLHWVPISAWGSRGGDMGVTTGEWVLTKKGTTAPLVAGTYVTVWRRVASGPWRALIDIGEPDPKPEPNAATAP